MKKIITITIALLVIPMLYFSCIHSPSLPPESRPKNWAQALKKPGLENLHKINNDFYRSAQPEKNGFVECEKMKVKTVINLRQLHDDADLTTKDSSLKLVRIPIYTGSLKDEQVIHFLKIMNDARNKPVLLHCRHGSDRTGAMAAIYRIVFEGWTKKAALDEMKLGGYGYHPMWMDLITYVEKMDVEKIKKSAGVK